KKLYPTIQRLCDHFIRNNLCRGVYGLAKAIIKECLICQKVNQKVIRKVAPGERELALRPFQGIQIGFTEMLSVQGYKHLLVIVDHLTHWVEAFPTKRETAQLVARVILENIIPRYGMVNTIDSDQDPYFMAQTLQNIIEVLGMKWRLHTLWHPQSSGRVEWMNKNVLPKLIKETKMNWLKCLPLVLLHIRTRPWSDTGISPHEIMFGLPFLLTPYSTGDYLEGEEATRKHLEVIGKTLEGLRKRGYLPQTSPVDTKVHNINPGDWALIKSWNS
ncbi:TF211 protein, partial [Setophaga kirtlandii]|nr:TF211 protein [Setophaga kirtlandii]